jgi:hypothetical protein
MGGPTSEAERTAGHQLPVRGPAFPVRRYVVPATHFFDFAGAKSNKMKWKFTKVGEPRFYFAGLCACGVRRPTAVRRSPVDGRSERGCRANPRPADGHLGAAGLVTVAPGDREREMIAVRAPDRVIDGRAGSVISKSAPSQKPTLFRRFFGYTALIEPISRCIYFRQMLLHPLTEG